MTQNKKTPDHPEPNEKLRDYLLVDIDSLKLYEQNAKRHTAKQVIQIANSIRQFGFIAPVIVDQNQVVIAGHGRLEAAKQLILKKVPIIRIDHLSDPEIRAYRLADNKLTMNTGFDEGLLKIEISDLIGLDLEFELEDIGFVTAELDLLLDDIVEENDPADQIPETETLSPVSKKGDIWQLGIHRLVCGDARNPEVYKRLLQEESADMVFTDPPYNVPVDGHVCGSGKVKHEEFAMASGEMSDEEFWAFLNEIIANLINYTSNGSLHYIFMDWRGIYHLLAVGDRHYSALKNICVWNKDNGGMGSLYRSKHELVTVFKNGIAKHINNIELGKHGRYRTNVWDYPGVNGFGGQKDLAMHPTVKPVNLIADAIKDCTRRGQIILDPFAGSGSTLIACEKSGRIARCIELESKYCDVIIRRWQDYTGQQAVKLDYVALNEKGVRNK